MMLVYCYIVLIADDVGMLFVVLITDDVGMLCRCSYS